MFSVSLFVRNLIASYVHFLAFNQCPFRQMSLRTRINRNERYGDVGVRGERYRLTSNALFYVGGDLLSKELANSWFKLTQIHNQKHLSSCITAQRMASA
jgi:hypothetical protein